MAFSARMAFKEELKQLSAKALGAGMKTCFFTGFMKYEYKYLAEHPEHRLVTAGEYLDQDGISSKNWGCPYNPEFQKRYFDFLEFLARIDGADEIWINDEASMGSGCYCPVCLKMFKDEHGYDMPLMSNISAENWQDIKWRR